MGRAAVAKAYADINAAVAVLSAELDGNALGDATDADPLQGMADVCLDILAGVAGAEPRYAALKARAVATFADTAASAAPPDAATMPLEASVAAEIACVLAIGPRAAGALLAESQELATRLPLTLSALQAGTVSWQHARVMVDETASLDPDGAAALEAHFLDPDAPNPARGCPAGDMPASRFRHKARIWRERHHTVSIEKRHAKSVLDRRVDYTPDKDGMAWISACLPADQASAIWNRITAVARGLQGADEFRTLTQIRTDVYSAALPRRRERPRYWRRWGNGESRASPHAPGGGPGDGPGVFPARRHR